MKPGDTAYLSDRFGEITHFLPQDIYYHDNHIRLRTWERDERGKRRKISKLFPRSQVRGIQPALFDFTKL